MLGQHPCQLGLVARRETLRARRLDLEHGVATDRSEECRRLRLGSGELVGAPVIVHPFRGLEDRLVSGAAAEVAGQRVAGLGPARRLLLAEQGEQRHDEARGTEAALRSVAVHHRLLHRVQRAVRTLQILHGDELLAVQGRQELDAGIDGTIADPVAVQLTQRHGTGAAIALGAALLGAGAAIGPQPLQNGGHRVEPGDRHLLSAQYESNTARHCRRPAAFR